MTDSAGEVPESVRASVQQSEQEVLLHHLLGIPYRELAARNDGEVARYIAGYIFRRIDETRSSMSRLELEELLDRNIQNAMRDIAPVGQNVLFLNDPRRVQGIARAAYESIPADIIEKFAVAKIPVRTNVNENNLSSRVTINATINLVNADIVIDLDQRFWKENDFRTEADLVHALEGRTPADIGITHRTSPVHRTRYHFDAADAASIAAARFNSVSIPQTKIGNRDVRVDVGQRQQPIVVNIVELLNGQTGPDAPPGLANGSVANFSSYQIRDLLVYQDPTTQRYPYWERFVSANDVRPIDGDSSRPGMSALDAAMKVVDGARSLWDSNQDTVVVAGVPATLTVKNTALLSSRTGADPALLPESLRNTLLRDMSLAQLKQVLLFEVGGRFPYWEQIIDLNPPRGPRRRNDIESENLVDTALRCIGRDWKKWDRNTENLNVAETVQLRVKVDDLLAGKTDLDAPAGLQNKQIADLTYEEIKHLFEHSGDKGDYPYWKKFVEAGTRSPSDLEFVTQNSPPGRARSFSSIAVGILMAARSATDMDMTIGTQKIDLLSAHRDVRSRHDEGKKFLEKLRTGSENPQAAALAAAMALRDPDIRASVESNAEEEKTRKDLNKVRAKQQLSIHLKKLGDLKTNFRIPDIGGTAANYQNVLKERNDLIRDSGAIGTAAAWTSKFCQNGGFPAPNAITARDDRNVMTAKIQQQFKEVSEELARYEEVIDALKRIASEAANADVFGSSTELSRLVSSAGVVAQTEIKSDFNQVDAAQKIKDQIKLETDADLEASVKKNEETLKKIKEGGEKGDALQQKIFEAHFRKQGLSEAEAQKAANYMYTRSLVDHELSGQREALLDDLFPEEHEPERFKDRALQGVRGAVDWLSGPSGKPQEVLYHIAHGLTVPSASVRGEGRRFGWESLLNGAAGNRGYQRLVTAYFSLKKVYEGQAPEYINCPGSPVIRAEMKRIARALANAQVQMLMNDFGNDLPDEDKKKLASRKTLSIEVMEKLLTGDAPEKYHQKIDDLLHHADADTHVFKRTTKTVAAAPFKYGYKAAKYTAGKTVDAVKATAGWTWGQKKNIAACAALTVLGGPLGFAGWAGYKMFFSGSKPAAASSSHH